MKKFVIIISMFYNKCSKLSIAYEKGAEPITVVSALIRLSGYLYVFFWLFFFFNRGFSINLRALFDFRGFIANLRPQSVILLLTLNTPTFGQRPSLFLSTLFDLLPYGSMVSQGLPSCHRTSALLTCQFFAYAHMIFSQECIDSISLYYF